jgi:N-6 DNA Methylase
MAITSLIDELGYTQSAKFISPTNAARLPPSELSFALRHLVESCEELSKKSHHCSFGGTYILQQTAGGATVPVVYVFEAQTETTARKIHKIVWNQNLVPFVIVNSESAVRVYPGFAYLPEQDNPLINVLSATTDVLDRLAVFGAGSIDRGILWEQWGHAADPTQRVDEKLLRDLKTLDHILQSTGMSREASHGLIGKFVYLYYLRHRDILSDRKLEKWGVDSSDLFSRNATVKAFREVNEQLQDWLNGSVFQLADDALTNLSQAQLREVAGVFRGDAPHGQLHLDFQAYDFSHIPIETLSCVYEQFLHDNSNEGEPSLGERLGAYYTPIPLADYVIAEMERKRAFREGMKVLDPACGSGTFLVECYRRLIEKKIRSEGRRLKTSELRELLTRHIFGIDRDDDACRIAELSLILTLLDYVEPPDLENSNFKLPKLRQSNIFKDDFFNDEGDWHSALGDVSFDWIIGNPPWSEVTGEPAADHEHYYVAKWIKQKKRTHPTGGNQVAEAFLWKAGEDLSSKGVSGLVVPAMTWFKKESAAFRSRFFSQREVWCIANFANMASELFARRAESPASAAFFLRRSPSQDHSILSFAPFVAEQVANRPQRANSRAFTWNIIVNGGEVQEVPNQSAIEGNAITWKFAMWGSNRDARLLNKLKNHFESFQSFSSRNKLIAHQGLELRDARTKPDEALEYHPDLAGKLRLESSKLRMLGRVFSFPESALAEIPTTKSHVRRGRSELPKAVSKPPHILLDASRRFAVFSNDFIAVPARQVGIAGGRDKEKLLRALSLYLSSDFFTYHQFFVSPQWGVYFNRADLDDLKELPVPLQQLSDNEQSEWQELQRELASLSQRRFESQRWKDYDYAQFMACTEDLNNRVFKALGVRSSERWLVEDFVHLNLQMNKGKVTTETMRAPTKSELKLYLTTLRGFLDAFISPERGLHHRLAAVVEGEAAIFSVSLERTATAIDPLIAYADQEEAKTLLTLRNRLKQKHSQWIYFDRNLKVYHQGVLYQFKPMQRLHWTRRQAVLDSDEIIAESVSKGT